MYHLLSCTFFFSSRTYCRHQWDLEVKKNEMYKAAIQQQLLHEGLDESYQLPKTEEV